jgi:hypothetical protein
LDPLVQKSTRIVRQPEQLLEPYRVLFEEMKEKQKQLTSQRVCKEKKNTKEFYNIVFGGEVDYSRIFTFHGGSWNLYTRKAMDECNSQKILTPRTTLSVVFLVP